MDPSINNNNNNSSQNSQSSSSSIYLKQESIWNEQPVFSAQTTTFLPPFVPPETDFLFPELQADDFQFPFGNGEVRSAPLSRSQPPHVINNATRTQSQMEKINETTDENNNVETSKSKKKKRNSPKLPLSSASPFSLPSTSLGTEDIFAMTILHKPRGFKGVWQKVAAYDALRVTKGKGKWLKLKIESRIPFDSKKMEIFLLDITHNFQSIPKLEHSRDEGVMIESISEIQLQGVNYVSEIELKLDRICKKLQFWALIPSSQGAVFKVPSVIFEAHNNGKASNKSQFIEGVSSNSLSSSPIEIITTPPNEPSNISAQYQTRKRRRDEEFQQRSLSHSRLDDSDNRNIIVPGSLKVNGVVRARGFIQFSDLRLKTNISDISDALNLLSRLEGKTYVWKNEELNKLTGGRRVIGLIAQQVQQVIPEVVHEDSLGFLSVSYTELVPIIIEAFKDHMRQYNTDKKEIQDQIQELKEKIAELENFNKPTIQAGNENVQSPIAPESSPKTEDENVKESIIQKPVLPFELSLPEEKKSRCISSTIIRVSIILAFFLGIGTIALGAIFLGITIAGPNYIIDTTVIQASDLKPMNRNGSSNPYIVVEIGAQNFQTPIVWNTLNPYFDASFSAGLDKQVLKVYYQVYDQSQDSGVFSSRRMGYTSISMDSLQEGHEQNLWLSLIPNIEGDTVSGSVNVTILFNSAKRPTFELALLIVGVLFSFGSLIAGFYSWKGQTKPNNTSPTIVQIDTN